MILIRVEPQRRFHPKPAQVLLPLGEGERRADEGLLIFFEGSLSNRSLTPTPLPTGEGLFRCDFPS